MTEDHEGWESVVVAPEGRGLRLDVFLSRRFPSWSRSFWRALARRGGVAIEREGLSSGLPQPSRRLLEGDRILLDKTQLTTESPETFRGTIATLLETPRFLAVDKPPGLLCHPAGRFGTGSLVCLLRARFGTLLPCGRLDRFTSGVNLFARTHEALADFEAAATGGHVEKEYLALVEGQPPAPDGVITAPIGRDLHSPIRLKMAVVDGGKPCKTSYRILSTRQGHSLLLVTLHTGRKHQIRLHLAHVGCPIVGDKLYGSVVDLDYFTPGRGNLHSYWPGWHGLHCLRLGLPPGLAGSDAHTISAPPSGPLAEVLDTLELQPSRY